MRSKNCVTIFSLSQLSVYICAFVVEGILDQYILDQYILFYDRHKFMGTVY